MNRLGGSELRSGVARRTLNGGMATVASHSAQLVMTLGFNVVVARVLSPREFGVVALAMTVAGFLQVFKDAGLPTATIQRASITQAQVSNLFWLNVLIGSVAAAIMAAASPLVALFFREPELVWVTIVLAAVFVIEGLSAQHQALLSRQMQFGVMSAISVASSAAGLTLGLSLAMAGWSYWSLVAATITTALLRAGSVWVASDWRPGLPTRRSGVRPMVKFGVDLTLVGVVYAVARGCDSVIVGRYLGTEAVGLYSRATVLLTRPLESLTGPIAGVIVPALSRLQDEPTAYRRAFLRTFELLVIGGSVFTGLLFPLSEPLVRVVLGDNWLTVAPIFAALVISALHIPTATATSWLYTSQGRGRELLLVAVVQGAIMIAAFTMGIQFGPAGVAVMYSVSGIFAVLPLTFGVAGRSGPVTARDLWGAYWRHVPILLTVLLVTWTAAIAAVALTLTPFEQLSVCVPAGVIAAAVSIFALRSARETVLDVLSAWRGGRMRAAQS